MAEKATKKRRATKAAGPPVPAATVTAAVLAKICRCHIRTIYRYRESGIIDGDAAGKFALWKSIGQIMEHHRKAASGLESDGVSAAKANAAFKDSQRKLNEMKLAQIEGSLIPIADVEEMWGGMVTSVRQLFMALPGRAVADLPHLVGPDQQILRNLVRDMLHEVAISGKPKLPSIIADIEAEADAP